MNVIYARQSIDKKDSLSIEAQIEQCRKFAGTDAKVYKDKGYSGKNIKRPDFTELIKAVESGAVKKIFVLLRILAVCGSFWRNTGLNSTQQQKTSIHQRP